MNALSREVATPETRLSFKNIAITDTGGGGMLVPQNFGEVIAFSELMSRAGVAIPKHLRDMPGACMALTMQALRWEMDPFAVANKSYSVSDRLAYEAQLIAAVVITRAPIAARPDYSYSGEGPERRCKVSVTMKDGTIKEYETPPVSQITVKNSPLWKSDPDMQLGYVAIRSWARRHTPEVLLGVYALEELDQIADREAATPRDRLTAPAARIAERLASAKTGTEGFAGEAFVDREAKPATGGKVIDAKANEPKPFDFEATLQSFDAACAAIKTLPELDAFAAMTATAEGGWFLNGDDAIQSRAKAIYNHHADQHAPGQPEASAAVDSRAELESQDTTAHNDPPFDTSDDAAGDDGDDAPESEADRLLNEARGVATNGVRKLKFWLGKRSQSEHDLLKPQIDSLMQVATVADDAL